MNSKLSEAIGLSKQAMQLQTKAAALLQECRGEEESKSLQLEPHNFKVDSSGWKEKTDFYSGIRYKEASTEDIWEIVGHKKHPELNGEQLFTWDAAMRETGKAGKRIPTEEEWGILLKTKEDMPNLVFAGTRTTDLFSSLGSYGHFWSSLEDGSATWSRGWSSGVSTFPRYPYSEEVGFSVRCLKD